MSSFKLHEVKSRDEFDAVIESQWIGMQQPLRPFFPWLHPVYGFTEEDRVASVKADADRRWGGHTNNEASHWIYVTANGEVVGAVNWLIYSKNPYPNGPPRLQCTWFPEGETRDFVTEFINQTSYARMNWMDRPHIMLSAMAVIPSMRKHGVGTLLMGYGIEKAEELNLECFTEASDPGMDLYERFGFRKLMTFAVNMHKKNPSPTWTRLQAQYPMATSTLMWRPPPKHLDDTTSFWDVLKGGTEE